MKRLYTMITALLLVVAATAQTTPTKMKINLTNGLSQTFELANISDITFEGEDEVIPEPSSEVLEIIIPTDFSESNVIKVLNGDQQVAEICKEYVRSYGVVDAQMVVIYPMGSDGKADLTKGFSAYDGGSLVWDLENDSVKSYTVGEGALTKIYMQDGAFLTSTTATELVTATLEPYTIVDKRGLLETNTYPIVKIGTQYWMAENLKAKYLTDGTAIPMYKGTQVAEWKALTSPACHIIYDDVDDEYQIFSTYGCMYNGYTVKNEKIAPEGWAVTSADDWTKLKTYLKTSTGGKIRSTSAAVWNDGVSASNLSGLNIPGGGFFNPAGDGDDQLGNQVYYWTTSKGTDFLDRESDSYLKCMLMSKTSPINLTGNHTFEFGHYIRCIRK